MRKRYHCPKHQEATPSAVVYGDGYFCFGCSARGPTSELGLEPGSRPEVEYVEDIADSIASIQRLPKRRVRGFDLHSNDRGYYLLWPSFDYYKFRSLDVDARSKYRGPSGHKKPPFEVVVGRHSRLMLVEGEFNALSLAALEPAADIISPGGAGDFYSHDTNKRYLTYATKYETIDLVVDNDAPGAQAGIEAKAKLMTLGVPNVRIILVPRDFNDLYQESPEALAREATRLGLL